MPRDVLLRQNSLKVERRSSLDLEPEVFARSEEWRVVAETGQLIAGPPGTWTDFRGTGTQLRLPKHILAVLSCPSCKSPLALHRGVHRVDGGTGRVTPDLRCMVKNSAGEQCPFHRTAYLDRFNDKPLYCIVISQMGALKKTYCHAASESEARAHLWGALPPGAAIVGVAPAVGFHVQQTRGDGKDILSTD